MRECGTLANKWNQSLNSSPLFKVTSPNKHLHCVWSLPNFFMSPQGNRAARGNNERPVRSFVSSFAMQQRPLSMLPWWHPINIRKYGLWAGGYCSRWRSPNNIFTDKCLSMEINIVPRSVRQIQWLCVRLQITVGLIATGYFPPLRCGCSFLCERQKKYFNDELAQQL